MGVRLAWLVATALTSATAAHADAEPAARGDDLTLVYRATAECPPEHMLRARLRARLSAAARRGYALDISLIRVGDRVQGLLVLTPLRSDAGEASRRELAGAVCEDVAWALALIAVLALDGPDAASEPMAQLPAPAPAPTPPPATVVSPAAAITRAGRWRWHALASGALTRGVTADTLPAVLLGARVERRRLYHLWLAAIIGVQHEVTSTDAEVDYLWTAARGGFCWNLDPESLWAELCADLDVGALRARASEVARASAARRLWLGAGGHVGMAYPKHARVFAQLQAGLLAPLVRDRIYLTPGATVSTTQVAVPWVALGLGWRFR